MKQFYEYSTDYISGVMSLRKPQRESLEILHNLCSKIVLKKDIDLQAALKTVHGEYLTCTSFERDFLSLTFALATGVGKTRLMGAFITYLYTNHNIKNFFVVAPNLTIYNKLRADLSDPNNGKYVFKGLGCFATNLPTIITGDTYKDKGMNYGMGDVTINIFNISKFNKDFQNIKKLSEFLGQSYFKFLSDKEDLCILMDESHHYRAEKGFAALNELKPLLGMELTATPQVETPKGAEKFKNVVYEYNLKSALRDKFVKIPCALTRRGIEARNFTDEEMDRAKIHDGIAQHERTKVALELYAKNNDKRQVKPFILIVAKDTVHAGEIKDFISSDACFNGNYKYKVIEIHSNQKGLEKEENIKQLLEVEDFDNKIEIVVHVNILKEGWDVTNLYTIVPLRTAASKTLREQTIGRGLRLPYGARTGVKEVDSLTIVAHDKFEDIINEAMRPDSLFNKENIIFAEDLPSPNSEVITSVSKISEGSQLVIAGAFTELRKSGGMELSFEQEQAFVIVQNIIDKKISQTLSKAESSSCLGNKEVVDKIVDEVNKEVVNSPAAKIAEDFTDIYSRFVFDSISFQSEIIKKNIISIPRISVTAQVYAESYFENFELYTQVGFDFPPIDDILLVQDLVTNKTEEIRGEKQSIFLAESLENTIVNLLIDKPEIDYSSCSDLLYGLTEQALGHIRSRYAEADVRKVVLYNKQRIADQIYMQMMRHFKKNITLLEKVESYFSEIKPHNFECDKSKPLLPLYAGNYDGDIKQYVFNDFKKASHTLYKFQSDTERKFAVLLENSKPVLKWLRPAQNQFNLYYGEHSEHKYIPDFVAETDNACYLVEIKDRRFLKDPIVLEKGKVAKRFCRIANQGKVQKPWYYILIPDNMVSITADLNSIFEQCKEL